MSCCCEKVYKFCTLVPSCNSDAFKELFKDLADGDYTVQLEFLGARLNIPITVASNVVTIEPADLVKLNESFTYQGKVLNSEGETVPLTFETVEYDCFEFSTIYST